MKQICSIVIAAYVPGRNFARSESRQVSLLNLAKGYEQFQRVCFIWRQEIRALTKGR